MGGSREPCGDPAIWTLAPVPPDVHERMRLDHALSRVLQDARMRVEARLRVQADGRALERAMGLLPVLIAMTLGTDVPSARLRALSRRFLRTQALLGLDHKNLERGARCDRVNNTAPLLDLMGSRAGIMVCSIHLGSYFYVGAELLALGFDVNLVASRAMIKRQQFGWQRVAERHGRRVHVLYADRLSSTRLIVRTLQSGGLVLIYVDGQGGHSGPSSGRSHRTRGPFLSMPMRMWTGPAYLAQRTGARVVCAATWRESWGRRVLEFSDPQQVPREGGEQAPADFTRDMFRWFEPRARCRPEQWAGWVLPHLFLEETGSAPRATAEALEAERQRVESLLRMTKGRARLRAEPTRVGFLGEDGQCALIEGPTRRVLDVDALTVAVVRAAYRGVRLGRLPAKVNADVPRLSDIVARLTLAGLARVEGPGASPD